ncbi:1-aminocyclopropane-1-carboxylate deaminase/D-cysteine desulfhydrase [Cognataquiflexum aquatile]|uniref:1-aminocyclopropane-1-carboxylate deaminase/D-cysteine desulfhydrase n=1 Tax=Cognataquiflexum aquatile TaxID=2249427 RepID=UPI0029374991|nr:pyridoxal-phosphate dependent enzyme [Cognataquiflexum aquatile]
MLKEFYIQLFLIKIILIHHVCHSAKIRAFAKDLVICRNIGKTLLLPNPISTQEIHLPLIEENGIRLSIKRLDQVHDLVSGNKFYKLKYNLEEAQKSGFSTVLTFGGAFSNHIHATAAAARIEGFKPIGIIRGEETFPLNPTLSFAKAQGMQLDFISREDYRKKTDASFIGKLKEKFGDFYLIPEGGTNAFAVKGTKEILGKEDAEFTHIGCSIGTGGTFAGLAESIKPHQNLLGFSSLKGDFIHSEINHLLEKNHINPLGKYSIFDRYHFGGYGKSGPELLEFIQWFYAQTRIPLDPIYTGKMMFGIIDLIRKDFFEKGSHILAIHSGGLQGIPGFNQRLGTSLPL